MTLSVKERGQAVATHRYILVNLMETLARWVPTTPEMEVKLLFGSHVWDVAQHADALGKRTHELRLPLQHSLEPAPEYIRLLDEVANIEDTRQRIAAFYDVVVPALDARYREYLAATDHLMDAPTVRILERILTDDARMIRESQELRSKLPELQHREIGWASALARREAGLGGPVAAVSAEAAQQAS
jgi:hypothetical protein